MTSQKTLKIILPIVAFIAFILLWYFVVYIFDFKPYVLPLPHVVIMRAWQSAGQLLEAVLFTLRAALSGYLLGATIGLIVALIFSQSRIAELSFYPYAIALQTVPIIAMAPLIILWAGTGQLARTIIAAIITIFPIIVNATKGLISTEHSALALMRTYASSGIQVFFLLRLPAALPFIFTGLRISTTLCIVGAIVAEFVTGNAGLGFIIIQASYRLDTPYLFAAIIVSVITGISLFLIVSFIEWLFLRSWHESAIATEV